MPDFAGSKTQRVDIYVCMASRPAYTPARLAAWTAPQNYVLLFSQHLPAGASKKPQYPARSLPASAGNNLPPHIFLYQPHSLHPASNLHSGLTGQHAPALILFLSLSFFFPPTTPFSPTKRETDFADFPIFFTIPNPIQASLSRFPSPLFSPSSQYTLPHRPRSCHT